MAFSENTLAGIITGQQTYAHGWTAAAQIGPVPLVGGRVHEVMGTSADGFIATVLKQTAGSVIWVGTRETLSTLCPLAFVPYFDPRRLMTIEAQARQERLWSAAQALNTKSVSLVILDLNRGPDLNESRHLQLAARDGQTLGLIHISGHARSSAAHTRWECTPAPQTHDKAVGRAWHWNLVKNKSGPTGQWTVYGKEGDYATDYVDMVSTSPT